MMLFDGCSWTMGCELEGPDKDLAKRERERWSTLVSDHFKTDHVNLGEGGKSNDGILRTTIEYCENHKIDFAVIQFTKNNRREILNCKKGVIQPNGNWYFRLIGSNTDRASLSYLKNLRSDDDDIANYYKNKFLLEFYFKVKKIPYFFMTLNRRKSMKIIGAPTSWQLMSDSKPVTCLYNLLQGDLSNYYYRIPQKGGHPSEKGHRKIADFIIENVSEYIL